MPSIKYHSNWHCLLRAVCVLCPDRHRQKFSTIVCALHSAQSTCYLRHSKHVHVHWEREKEPKLAIDSHAIQPAYTYTWYSSYMQRIFLQRYSQQQQQFGCHALHSYDAIVRWTFCSLSLIWYFALLHCQWVIWKWKRTSERSVW